MHTIFIDGREGTTGLQIQERLNQRTDLRLLNISDEDRKNPEVKKLVFNEADLVILCLPDQASREAVGLIDPEKTKIIDTSTAFRTDKEWTYGLPELHSGQREAIRQARKVANPGCHATGFIMALYPLVQQQIVLPDYPVVAQSLTGYSGGGKKLIGVYEPEAGETGYLRGPRFYALSLKHKHLPEMQLITGLKFPPLFTPIVGHFYQGMVVSIPLVTRLLPKKISAREVHETLVNYYKGESFVRVIPFESAPFLDNGFLSPTDCSQTNRIDLFVFGDDQQILLAARLDNLGKGASGAAVQNMNIMLGVEESLGLDK
jgi:N-acetyl-gamma-glutamyl-phosphate reductase